METRTGNTGSAPVDSSRNSDAARLSSPGERAWTSGREVTHQTDPGPRFNDCGGGQRDRVLVRLGRILAFQRRGPQREERPVPDRRRRVTVHVFRDFLQARTTPDRRPGQGLFARRNEVQVRPCPLLQGGVLGLWDPRLVGGPFLQARSFRDRPTKCTGEDDGALDAPPQWAREDRRRTVRWPLPDQRADLVFSSFRERGAIEIRRVRGADNLAVSHEDERRGHAGTPPDTTTITRILSPSLKISSAGIGPSPRIKMCASGASRRAFHRSRPLAAVPSAIDSSLRPGRISAVTRIGPSRTIRDLSVLSQERSPELLSESSFSGCIDAQL